MFFIIPRKIGILCATSILALVAGGCTIPDITIPDMQTAKVALKAGDYDTAHKNYEKLSDFGIPEARMELALLELKGEGDPRRGIALLERAADDNDPRALFELGKLYQDGKKVGKDIPKASDLYRRALKLGYVRSYYQLGTISEDQTHYTEAESLYRQAYSTGYFKAAAKIASLYKNGRGRPVDLFQALTWYYVAQRHAVPDLEDQIAAIETKLSPEKISAARNLSEGLY